MMVQEPTMITKLANDVGEADVTKRVRNHSKLYAFVSESQKRIHLRSRPSSGHASDGSPAFRLTGGQTSEGCADAMVACCIIRRLYCARGPVELGPLDTLWDLVLAG